jgi:hypothetical protein
MHIMFYFTHHHILEYHNVDNGDDDDNINILHCNVYFRIGTGDPSDILNTRTKGSKPVIPEAGRFIEVSSNSITLHLSAWGDGGCPMLYFVVEHKKK